MRGKRWIVVAWVDMTDLEACGSWKPDGVNTVRKFKPAAKGHAAVWLREGVQADVSRARDYAASITGVEHVAVYEFDPSEQEPLQRGRDQVLLDWAKTKGR